MTSNGWWMLIGLALLAGVAVGGWVTLRIAQLRHTAQSRRAIDEVQQKLAATIDQLRAVQVRAQTELEQVRNSFKRQLAVVADEPRAAAARAEERLRAAYEELDRLRRGSRVPDTKPSELSDGFAATRPMRESL
jgi:MinD-like ATPase involved in chromosome partitioning or flagellar assembly